MTSYVGIPNFYVVCRQMELNKPREQVYPQYRDSGSGASKGQLGAQGARSSDFGLQAMEISRQLLYAVLNYYKPLFIQKFQVQKVGFPSILFCHLYINMCS